jgi:predicted CxxxxCH...CXXCH cytochrome family protein
MVDVYDALLTLQYSVGLYKPADEASFKAAADVAPLESGMPKGDGQVNVFDSLSILRHAVGLDAWDPNAIAVPNVVGQTEAAARNAITGAGFTVGAVTRQSSNTVPNGAVVSQTPLAGAYISPGTAVNLVVSSGPSQATVPNLVGQTTADVQTAVSSVGLVVGTVTQQHHATVPNGKVISQSPSAGATASPGAAISVAISSGPAPASTQYVVVAWNDLGMHCLNPSYDTAVILPPYNTIWAQVVRRGTTPQIITSGISIDYRIINNTTSVSAVKGTFAQFWDTFYMNKLFGTVLEPDTGLNLVDKNLHNRLTGAMVQKGNHFQVDGIPVTPVNDFGVKNPYQVAEITVKDTAGTVLAQTLATVPTSDEFSCGKCHFGDDPNPFVDMLIKHDRNQGTTLVSNRPVLCASCHGSPALGAPLTPGIKYLSQAIHGYHAGKTSPGGAAIGCNDCHPGPTARCNRSQAHSDPTKVVPAIGNSESCSNINCHGDLSKIANDINKGLKVPWIDEPRCVNCHTGVTGVDTGATLFRNASGHGGLSCAGCHGSPHAMYPVSAASSDQTGNYQAQQYQGAAKTLGSCISSCHEHPTSRGGGSNILEEHGSGKFGGKTVSCGICHTGFVNPATGNWPHGYTWKGRP